VGQTVSEDERFRTERTWLRGIATGRYALVLQFAAGMAPFEEMFLPGATIAATLAYWPGAFPQRALLQERHADGERVARLPGFEDIAAFLDSAASAYARQPFLERLCCTARDVAVLHDEGGFAICDRKGATLPIAGRDEWMLLALSGGRPVDVAGEWNGRALFPLSVAAEGVFHELREHE
jgi:hypothetical protein